LDRVDRIIYSSFITAANIKLFEAELAAKKASPFYYIRRFFTWCRLWM